MVDLILWRAQLEEYARGLLKENTMADTKIPFTMQHTVLKRDANGRFLSKGNKASRKRKPKAPKAPQATVQAKQLTNRFVICLDSSGSMQGIQAAAVAAFNKNVQAIIDGAAKSGQISTVSFYTFGEGMGEVRTKFFNEGVSSLRPLGQNEFRPQGNTPLFDCVGTAIEHLRNLQDSPETSYVIIVITDGAENASNRYDRNKLSTLMREVTGTDRWTFAFLVPPGSKEYMARNLGIPEGNVQEWEATTQGMNTAAYSTTLGISSYYQARSVGKTSTKGFFTTNLSNVTANQVQRKLTDIRDRVSIWGVDKGEVQIRDFVQARGAAYQPGNAYYQLTKDELVQAYKQVLLVEKGKGSVYAGADARYLLNLPNQDVKVRPGNHANWDVFIQSTSNNRKLVRGTKLVYVK